ncbi:K(+)-transporting ATPase subunit F [Flavonifractor porci]
MHKSNHLGGTAMILLGMIVLLLGGYLVYALAHPDRF